MKKIVLIFGMLLAMGTACGEKPVISILGDSYSTFEGWVEPDTNLVWYVDEERSITDVDTVTDTWWGILTNEKAPYELGVNNSYSGATVCYTGYNGDDYRDRAFITRMDNLGQPDVILVFGATNDSWAGSPIGEYKWSDWTDEELYTFRPAMAKMLDGLQRMYPDAKLAFILNTELKPEINESAARICDHYGVTLIRLRDIDKQTGHPSVKGMKEIARQVGEKLPRLLHN